MNRDLLAPGALTAALGELKSFCVEVQRGVADPALRAAARAHEGAVSDLEAVVDHFFLHEGRDPDLDRAPEEELRRQPAGDPGELSDRPVFLVGDGRSGSSLALHLLNTSASLAAVPEVHLGSAFSELEAIVQLGLRVREARGAPFPGYLRRLGQTIDGVYSDYARRQNKTRWASKEHRAPHHLDILDAMFDYRARYVFCVRHALDVVWSSACRFPMKDGLPFTPTTGLSLEAYLEQWLSRNELTLDFCERNPERCLVHRYEDFVAEPATMGKRLFDFVGEPWSDDCLRRLGGQHLARAGDNKFYKTNGSIVASKSTWRDWPPGLLTTFARKANPTLERLGYEPIPAPRGARTRSPLAPSPVAKGSRAELASNGEL